jgi:biotin operon repressor
MDPVKEAFLKIKEDILFLKDEIKHIRSELSKARITQTTPTHNQSQTPQQTNTSTHIQTTPTHNQHIQPPYTQNIPISTGNEGVPTHKPTNQHTNQPLQNTSNIDFKEANNIFESLDSIKKGIRLKFKRLTPQEMLVFNTLYTLEEQKYTDITYKVIATQLNLSESSIRDYINKLINKGIPIEKTRQNNKIIILNISPDLKNITTLATIQTLREL